MRRLALIFAVAITLGGPAYGASELSRINAQIKQTEQQNKKLQAQVKSAQRDVEQTKKKLVKAADQVSTLEEQRGIVTRKIFELDTKINLLSHSIEENRERIADAAASVLFFASHPSFNTDDMYEYALTSSVLAGAAAQFDTVMQQQQQQVKELTEMRAARAIEKEKLDRTAKKYAAEKQELDKLLRARSAQNEKLKNQQAAVQKKLRELSARAKNISELSAGVGSSKMSSDARFSKRKLNMPVRGRLTVRYGEKTALGLNSDGWRIRTRGDALVQAPADGVVKFADSFKGFGKVIIMSHQNGYNTVMTNLGSIDVIVGQEVLGGEPIGRMDSGKPDMYLEVRRGNKAVNPANLFKEPE